jgi:hypothetical protein
MKQDCSRNATLAMSLCLFLTGCGETRTKPLAEGFEEIDVTYQGWEPAMTQRQLAHTDSIGRKAIIWPWVFSGIFISNNLVVFMGENPEYDHRLIAVSPPELPMDITPQVIGSWAREAGMDVSNVIATANLMDCKQAANNDLELYVGFGDMNKYTNINILVKWGQIPDMMSQVREKGIERKDRKFGVIYLTTEFTKPAGSP